MSEQPAGPWWKASIEGRGFGSFIHTYSAIRVYPTTRTTASQARLTLKPKQGNIDPNPP